MRSLSWRMTEYLIKNGRIGCVPGVDFGANGEGYVRFCFARDRKELTGALAVDEALFGVPSLAGWQAGRQAADAAALPPDLLATCLTCAISRAVRRRRGSVSPVMKSLSSSASTAFAISISPPQRPSGVASSTAFSSSSVVPGGARIGPGAIALTRMLSAASSSASASVSAMTPGLRDVVRQVAVIARPAALRDPVAEVDDAAAALRAACAARPRARRETPRADRRRRRAFQSAAVSVVERLLRVDRRHVDRGCRGGRRRRRPTATSARARVGLREIGLNAARAPPGRAHASAASLGLGLRARVAERDVDAARRAARAATTTTDALAAGDQRDFVSEIHRITDTAMNTRQARRQRI